MLKFIKISFIIVLSILFTKCANIVQPTGGPKDITAPSIKSKFPADKALNFKDKKVIIEFDENVTINNANQEIQITPSIGNDYNISAKKKVVTLEFTKPLKENTTYRINFNKAIKDLTEGNVPKDLTIIFSTGEKIDSIYIRGKVKSIANNKNVDAIVALYNTSDTLNIFKQKPYIYTKAKEGIYSLENIKDGKYEIIAFEDLNNNNIVDKNESFGFNNTSLVLNKSINELNINILKQKNTDSLKVTNTFVLGNKIDIDVNNGLTKADVKANNIKYSVDKNFKHISIYNLGDYKDSLEINLSLEDSNSNVIHKKMKFKTEEKKKKKETAAISPLTNSKIIVDKDKIEISFSKPIIDLKRNNLFKLYQDNAPAKYMELNKDYTVNEYNDKIQIVNKLMANDSIKIETDKNVQLFTINQDTVFNIKVKYLITDVIETGSIQGKINTDKKSFIIQLVDTKHTVIEEIRNTKEYTFNKLKPTKYFVRVVDDSNNNGTWDTGDYTKKQQPESITYYNEEITLKENWEILDININLQ